MNIERIIAITRAKISFFLNPSIKLKIKYIQEMQAINGANSERAAAFAKELKFFAYLIAKRVVAIEITAKIIPKESAAI